MDQRESVASYVSYLALAEFLYIVELWNIFVLILVCDMLYLVTYIFISMEIFFLDIRIYSSIYALFNVPLCTLCILEMSFVFCIDPWPSISIPDMGDATRHY